MVQLTSKYVVPEYNPKTSDQGATNKFIEARAMRCQSCNFLALFAEMISR